LQLQPRDSHRQISLEDPAFDANRPDESSPVYGRYASPPHWFGLTGDQAGTTVDAGSQQIGMTMQTEQSNFQPTEDPLADPLSWLWPPVDMNIMYGIDASRWDTGNL